MHLKYLFIPLVALTIGGCTTSPVKISQARAVDPETIAVYGRPARDWVPVKFVRDDGFYASSLIMGISVNDYPIVGIGANEVATLYLPPGKKAVFGLHAFSNSASVEAMITPGNTYRYRVSFEYGDVHIYPYSD